MLLPYPRRTFHLVRLYFMAGLVALAKQQDFEKGFSSSVFLSFTRILVLNMVYDLIENLSALSKQWALISGSVGE